MKTSVVRHSTTRRLLLALTCAAALTAPIVAQDTSAPPPQQQAPGRGDMQQRQLEHMTQALSLSPDQVTQVQAIQADGRQQMMAVRTDTSIAPAEKHARMTTIHDAQDAKIRAILNDDQRSKFDAMQAKMKEHQEQRHERQQEGEQTPPPPPSAAS